MGFKALKGLGFRVGGGLRFEGFLASGVSKVKGLKGLKGLGTPGLGFRV